MNRTARNEKHSIYQVEGGQQKRFVICRVDFDLRGEKGTTMFSRDSDAPGTVKDLATLERLFNAVLKVLVDADILNGIWLQSGEFDEASAKNIDSPDPARVQGTAIVCRKWTVGDGGIIVVAVFAAIHDGEKKIFHIEWMSPRQSARKFPLTFEQVETACKKAKVPTVDDEVTAKELIRKIQKIVRSLIGQKKGHAMNKKLTALVVLGGTEEAVDDVRVLTNISKGGFGMAIAEALREQDLEVLILAGQGARDRYRYELSAYTTQPFRSTEDLQRRLYEIIDTRHPDIIFMAAAVSDYRPVRVEGKIRSDAEQLTINLVRTPKILPTLRERCGEQTYIVGFKLLSRVTEDELYRVAFGQVTTNGINLTVGNITDQIDWDAGRHPVLLVTPNGSRISISDKRPRVARELVKFVLASVRADTETISTGRENGHPEAVEAATIALVNLSRRRLLLGKRLVGFWPGFHAFPGGRRDPSDKDSFETACRELEEETGITLNGERPIKIVPRQVCDPQSGRTFQVTSFIVPIAWEPVPRTTTEMAAEWFDFDPAAPLLGLPTSLALGEGTQKLLERIAELFN